MTAEEEDLYLGDKDCEDFENDFQDGSYSLEHLYDYRLRRGE